MNHVFLSLGGNLGNRAENIAGALSAIQKSVGNIIMKSSVYETQAWGNKEQPNFLNIVIEVLTPLSADKLLTEIQKVETDFGRVRKEKWGSRTMDVDLLFFNNETISTESLNVPHPLIAERKFVLKPFAEIAPNFLHPTLNKTIKTMLFDCKDNLNVLPVNSKIHRF